MNKMNEMEKKGLKVSETELEHVVGGGELWERMKEVNLLLKDFAESNDLDSDTRNLRKDAASKHVMSLDKRIKK